MMPSEYRVRIIETGPDLKKKRYVAGDLEKCERFVENMKADRAKGRHVARSGYWNQIEMTIETREVTKWRPIENA